MKKIKSVGGSAAPGRLLRLLEGEQAQGGLHSLVNLGRGGHGRLGAFQDHPAAQEQASGKHGRQKSGGEQTGHIVSPFGLFSVSGLLPLPLRPSGRRGEGWASSQSERPGLHLTPEGLPRNRVVPRRPGVAASDVTGRPGPGAAVVSGARPSLPRPSA